MLNSYEHDPCCGKAIQKALGSGGIELMSEWTCPKCGEVWKPQLIERDGVAVMHWTMRPYISVLRLRG